MLSWLVPVLVSVLIVVGGSIWKLGINTGTTSADVKNMKDDIGEMKEDITILKSGVVDLNQHLSNLTFAVGFKKATENVDG